MKHWQSISVVLSGFFVGALVLTLVFQNIQNKSPFSQENLDSFASVVDSLPLQTSQIITLSTTTYPAVTGVANTTRPTAIESSGSATEAAPARPVYTYKFAYGIGDCGLSLYGQQGWQAVQFGTAQTPLSTFLDYTCKRQAFGIYYDWVLFQLQQ